MRPPPAHLHMREVEECVNVSFCCGLGLPKQPPSRRDQAALYSSSSTFERIRQAAAGEIGDSHSKRVLELEQQQVGFFFVG
jgi:hypothetical protein